MNTILKVLSFITLITTNTFLLAQDKTIEGYVFETDDRGYLNLVEIEFFEMDSDQAIDKTFSNQDGFFTLSLPANKTYQLKANKELFFEQIQTVKTTSSEPTIYLKVQMEREPGYILDVTMAQKKDSLDEEVDAIKGARVEIYNNTQEREELVLEDYPHINFQYTLKKGNHYTMLIRKKGFLAKRIEAYVNVNGCIVCIDGVGSLNPGVSDNLTQGFDMGTLLANVELDKINFDKVYTLNNIYYDLNKASLKPEAEVELNNLVTILKDNPTISIELGSHTDSRGKDNYNLRLSQKRAESAVKYLTGKGDIAISRIIARGYGETQLTNECGNDVNCSETDHQKNRRTEFKILNQSEETGYTSLVEIKRLERMDALINEVQNSEIVEIKAGDELPEDLKKQLARDQKLASKDQSKPSKNKKVDAKDNVKNKIKSTEITAKGAKISRKKSNNIKEVLESKHPESIPSQSMRNVKDEKFSGYLVKVYVAKESLSLDSPELSGMKDLWVLKVTDSLYYYFLGTFEDLDSAKSVHEKLAGNCAVCSIVKFENGSIRP